MMYPTSGSVRPTHGDAPHMMDSPTYSKDGPNSDRPVGAHEDHVNAVVKEFRNHQRTTHAQFTEAACKLRMRRIEVENQIDELNSEVEDINNAIRAYRIECGIRDEDVWEGFDDNHEPMPAMKHDSYRR